ncbi:MAG TPA: hypothetical protein VHE34_16830 [Puia sp.]|uniref:hypothetical protein n=1 Tax=Puia sp. TaxID=2045100 RepID=UPI002CE7523A|nr:hypothetical protein [Puia sp.]HVU96898.1 hypothetical protein [Puia sp.]
MSEVLWDTVVRAVEALEKKTAGLQNQVNSLPDHTVSLKNIDDRLGTAEAEIKELPNKIFMPLPQIISLTRVLQTHSQLLSMPVKTEVRHEHHLSKPIAACMVMFLIINGLLLWLYYAWSEADQHRENDMKYRYLKVFQSPNGQKYLHQLDSLYTSNPDQFRKVVMNQEKIQLDSFEDFKQMQEKRQEIKDLQEKWSRQPGGKSN